MSHGVCPDGNLYISGGTFGGKLGVRRYNPTTGAFIDFFAKTGDDLLVPIGIAFGPAAGTLPHHVGKVSRETSTRLHSMTCCRAGG